MSTDYKKDILPLVQQGMTHAQIVDHLKAKTLHGVSCSDVKILLEEAGLVIEDPITRNRSGLLVTHYQSMPDNETKALVGWYIGHVFGRGVEISSHTQPRATQIVNTIASLPGPMQAIGAKMIEMGGGQPHADLTIEAIADMQAAHEVSETEELRVAELDGLLAVIANDYIGPAKNNKSQNAETVKAAIKELL